MTQKRADLSKIKTVSIKQRKSKVTPSDFGMPFEPEGDSFRQFVRGLPRILVAEDLRAIVSAIVTSRRKGAPVLLLMGAHVVKVGLTPILIDLLKREVITSVSMNSAAAIHDVETALWGKTSEDVAETMIDGKFGMAKETGDIVNTTLSVAYRETDLGYGESLGKKLLDLKAPNNNVSILANCVLLNVPVTVHAAIGTDIVHQQPTMDGAATGEMSFRDFRELCSLCGGLTRAGVVLNVGSAVIMPEVFLKALTVARNLGAKARGFTTAVFDMNRHYRPAMNVQSRPTQEGGHGYYVTGHHEIMIPLLAAMVKAEMQ